MRIRVLSVTLIAIGAAGLAGAARASADITQLPATVAINASSAKLHALVLVDVPVTYSCTPMDQIEEQDTEVDLQQAVSGGNVALGGGGLFLYPQLPTCDGATHTVTSQVTQSNGKHFHTGLAIVRASFGIDGYLNGESVEEFAQIGWQTLRLRAAK
jgi:hypothetical protein